MRAVIQRVKESSVSVNNKLYSSIKKGYLILLGISGNDNKKDMDYIIDKIINLRIFNDENGKMNENIFSISGELLVVSQFTLYGDARKGRRPSYSKAANGNQAELIYEKFIEEIKMVYDPDRIKTGIFGEMMDIRILNDGPVTILLDSERLF